MQFCQILFINYKSIEQQTNLSTRQTSGQPVYVVSQRNKKIGLFLFIGSSVGLITILVIYAIVAFITNTSVSTGTESPSVVANIIKEQCIGCGHCVLACHPNCLKLENGKSTMIALEKCDSEGRCVSACPQKAIPHLEDQEC